LISSAATAARFTTRTASSARPTPRGRSDEDLILGIVGRGQIKSSNGQLGGLVLANIAIALHLVSLVWLVISMGPLLQTLLAR
jgi:hypothetical protein